MRHQRRVAKLQVVEANAAYSCPDDLAGPFSQLLADITFEIRALRDVQRAMTRSEDGEPLLRVMVSCQLLQEHILRLPALLAPSSRIAFCCLLDWYWRQERPLLQEALRQGRIARCAMAQEDYVRYWTMLAAPIERELAIYPRLTREYDQPSTAILRRRRPAEPATVG